VENHPKRRPVLDGSAGVARLILHIDLDTRKLGTDSGEQQKRSVSYVRQNGVRGHCGTRIEHGGTHGSTFNCSNVPENDAAVVIQSSGGHMRSDSRKFSVTVLGLSVL